MTAERPHGGGEGPMLSSEFAWIAELAPDEGAGIPEPASGLSQRAHVLSSLGPGPLDWGIQLGYRVADGITRELPVYSRQEGAFEALRTGTESTTLQLLTALASGRTERAATPESLAAATDFVHRRISLDEMMRGIQLGHGIMANAFFASCAQLGELGESLAQTRALSERMFKFFDLFVAEMSAHYRAEQLQWERSDTRARLAEATRLLEGGSPSPGTEQRLGYALDGPHAAVVAVGPQAEAEATAAALERLLSAARCTRRLVLHAGDGLVWAWGSPASESGIASAAAACGLPSGAYAATGSIATGLDGFLLSHREARGAVDALEAAPPPGRVVGYEEVDLLSLLLADAERARHFVARELGPLAAETAQAKDLRRTLAAFIDERGSPLAAAQRLSVSRNTVGYRVQRAEELLGRSVNERRLQLRCALLVRELLDEAEPDEQRAGGGPLA